MRANVRIGGHDGTVLVADAYPAAHGDPAPVVVTRTPYDRAAHRAEGLAWSRRGFGYVVQDVRGRYGSDGHWQLYRNERGDGAALVDWIVAQPWCDGRIVTLGGSYGAYTAWTMAVERPAAVSAVVSVGPAMGLAQVKYDRSGILRLAEHATWWAERAEARTSRTGLSAAMFAADPDLIRHLPVVDLPRRMWPDLEHWTDTIDHGPEHVDPEAVHDHELAALSAATLHIGGWYDLLIDQTLHQWRTAGSAAPGRRPPRSLLVGPWDHDLGHSPQTTVGCRDHGPASRVPLGQLLTNWLCTVLDGGHPHPAARVFVVGAGWTDQPHWPPPATEQTWHADRDGTLTRTPATAGAAYRYDPADPYPSADPGADRAALATRRPDAARFTSAPLTTGIAVTGTPVVHLDATSSAAATDFIARCVELTPAGQAVTVAQGAVHTGRDGTRPHRIPLDPVAIHLPAGSRLQLEITSSDFPHLARALGGTDRYRGAHLVPADQRITTATLTLPVVDDCPSDHPAAALDRTEG